MKTDELLYEQDLKILQPLERDEFLKVCVSAYAVMIGYTY